MKKISVFSIFIVIISAGLCPAADVITEPFEGVKHIHRTLTSPRPLNINIVKINMASENLSFKVTPSNGSSAGDADAKVVTQWVDDENAQIGINCGFFFWHDGGYDIMGYTASNGNAFSPFTAYAGWPDPYVSLHISYWNTPTMIYPRPGEPIGYSTAPLQQTWNAAPGSEWIIKDGINVVDTGWDHSSELHPRTAAGYNQDGSELILITIDGRQSGFSEGMTISEVADHLISIGVYQGINFDGGGSTTLAFADPSTHLVNVPSGTSQRSVPNALMAYADLKNDGNDLCIYADFEDGYEDTFAYSPGYSGSTDGIISASSTAEPVDTESWQGSWSEKLYIKDDSAVSSVPENPSGGWFVRWVSGSYASPSQNVSRDISGYVGFWAKTQTAGMQISLVVDDGENKMERGTVKDMPPDGRWHCYQWNLEDNSQWQGWINGDGVVNGSSFTLDSIQLFGPNSDAVVYVDKIMHNATGSIILETCADIWENGNGIISDLNEDCYVDIADLCLLANDWLTTDSQYDIAGTQTAETIDFSDFSVISNSWFNCNDPQQEECN
jgi:hypothetical protein